MYVLSPVVYTMHKALFKCPDLVTVCKTTQSCPYIISALSGDSGTLFVVSLILDARSVAGEVVLVILAVGFLRCACYPAVCACAIFLRCACYPAVCACAISEGACSNWLRRQGEANDRHLGAWLGLNTFSISLDILILISSPIICQSWHRFLGRVDSCVLIKHLYRDFILETFKSVTVSNRS